MIERIHVANDNKREVDSEAPHSTLLKEVSVPFVGKGNGILTEEMIEAAVRDEDVFHEDIRTRQVYHKLLEMHTLLRSSLWTKEIMDHHVVVLKKLLDID